MCVFVDKLCIPHTGPYFLNCFSDEKIDENFDQSGKRLSIASLVNEHPTKLSMVGTFEEDRQEMADVKEVEEPALAEVQEVFLQTLDLLCYTARVSNLFHALHP